MRYSYKHIADTLGSPSCVIDFLIWDIPILEAQVDGLDYFGELLEDGASMFSPSPPFDNGQTVVTVPLPPRLQQEILRVGKTLYGTEPLHTRVTTGSSGYTFVWSLEQATLFKLICRYLVSWALLLPRSKLLKPVG